jgi:hypothetical protein
MTQGAMARRQRRVVSRARGPPCPDPPRGRCGPAGQPNPNRMKRGGTHRNRVGDTLPFDAAEPLGSGTGWIESPSTTTARRWWELRGQCRRRRLLSCLPRFVGPARSEWKEWGGPNFTWGGFAYLRSSGKGHRSATVPPSPPRHATSASWRPQD